mgnify:FL=1
MRALVTGGAGYIGSVVSNHLLDEGHEVIIIDNLSTGMIDNIPKKAEFLKLDIADTKKLNKIFLKKKIDIVFHFAAFINNEESLKYPKKYFKNNFEKGKIFFENCIRNNINKFIYSSTAAVYGNKKSQVTEKDKLNPMSPYPKSKLKLEKFLMNKKKNISCVILRYFNVAGADTKLRCGFNVKKGYNLILNLCAASLKKKIFKINGNNYKTKDGTTIRDYIHVQDLARIHLLAANKVLNKKIFKTFNCGYGNGFSVMEILKKFNSISNRKIKFKIGKRRDSDIIISIADPKELVKFTKWKPKFNNLSLIVKSSLNWYKKSRLNN